MFLKQKKKKTKNKKNKKNKKKKKKQKRWVLKAWEEVRNVLELFHISIFLLLMTFTYYDYA